MLSERRLPPGGRASMVRSLHASRPWARMAQRVRDFLSYLSLGAMLMAIIAATITRRAAMVSAGRLDRARRLAAKTPAAVTEAVPPPRFLSIVEFVSSPEYLGRLRLYPRQLLLLKVVFLALEHLTD